MRKNKNGSVYPLPRRGIPGPLPGARSGGWARRRSSGGGAFAQGVWPGLLGRCWTLFPSGVAGSERQQVAILVAPLFTPVNKRVVPLRLRVAQIQPIPQFSVWTLFGVLRGGTGECTFLRSPRWLQYSRWQWEWEPDGRGWEEWLLWSEPERCSVVELLCSTQIVHNEHHVQAKRCPHMLLAPGYLRPQFHDWLCSRVVGFVAACPGHSDDVCSGSIVRVCWKHLAETPVRRSFNAHFRERFIHVPGEAGDIERGKQGLGTQGWAVLSLLSPGLRLTRWLKKTSRWQGPRGWTRYARSS